MDVMDFLVGWCGPQMKLEPEPTTEPQVNGHHAPPEGGRLTRQVLPAEGE
jgi:hypothetical protein